MNEVLHSQGWYAEVKRGEKAFELDSNGLAMDSRALQKQLEDAEKSLTNAQDDRENLNDLPQLSKNSQIKIEDLPVASAEDKTLLDHEVKIAQEKVDLIKAKLEVVGKKEKLSKQIADLIELSERVGYQDQEGTTKLLREAIAKLEAEKSALEQSAVGETKETQGVPESREDKLVVADLLNLRWLEELINADQNKINLDQLSEDQQKIVDELIRAKSKIFDTEPGKLLRSRYEQAKVEKGEQKAVSYLLSLYKEQEPSTQALRDELRAEIVNLEKYLDGKGIDISENNLREIAEVPPRENGADKNKPVGEEVKNQDKTAGTQESGVGKETTLGDLMSEFDSWISGATEELEKTNSTKDEEKIAETKQKLKGEYEEWLKKSKKLDENDRKDLKALTEGTDLLVELLKKEEPKQPSVDQPKKPDTESEAKGTATGPTGSTPGDSKQMEEELRRRLENDVKGEARENWFSKRFSSFRNLLQGKLPSWFKTVRRYAETNKNSDGSWPDEATESSEKQSVVEKITNKREAEKFIENIEDVIEQIESKVANGIAEESDYVKFSELEKLINEFHSRLEKLVLDKKISAAEKNSLGEDHLREQLINLSNEIKK